MLEQEVYEVPIVDEKRSRNSNGKLFRYNQGLN